ncbi:MAG TPA: ATP synthase subunit I [Polyangia bacterium]|jgi:hypothetical protein|nr:ATP synthase subunit I [Polyangia bacterium]
MKTLLLYLACFTLGLGLGIAYFLALRHNVRAYVEGGIGARGLALHAARFVATGAVFFWLAQYGALPVLLALVGFLAARQPVLRQALGPLDTPRGAS